MQKVLLLDDDSNVLELIRLELMAFGKLHERQILSSTNGRDAIRIIEEDDEYEIALVVCDFNLRETTGPVVVQMIQQIRPDIWILFYTGQAGNPKNLQEMKRCNPVAVIVKPDKDGLIKGVRSIVKPLFS